MAARRTLQLISSGSANEFCLSFSSICILCGFAFLVRETRRAPVRAPGPRFQTANGPARRPALLRTREIVQREETATTLAWRWHRSGQKIVAMACHAVPKRRERFVRPDGTEPGCRDMGSSASWLLVLADLCLCIRLAVPAHGHE
jgi:hypothetical protein